MFIRRTKTRSAEGGKVYYSYRLVRSERSGERVRQRTLLNLGSEFAVATEHWAVLCSRIEQLLERQGVLVELDCPEEVEREAQRIALQLVQRGAEVTAGGTDLQTVDVESLELERPRTVGVEHVGLWAMERLGLGRLLEGLGFNGRQRAVAVGSIIGRMGQPGSERASWRWLCERSGLGELLEVDFEAMSLMRLYRVSDALMAHREAIEKHLFEQVTELFGLGHTVTLYDLTNTFFEGEAADQPKAQRGHSKEKRSDCALLTLGLVLGRFGFRAPLRSVCRQGRRRQDAGADAQGSARARRRPGGDGCGDCHRGQRGLVARQRLPLSGGQPPTNPPLRPRAVHRHRDPVAPQGSPAQGGR